jgi:mono/diheme cytochrome c family protein
MKVIWIAGIVSAVLSCITGYVLSINGGYEESAVNLHMWMGIAVAAISILIGFKVFRRRFDTVYKAASIALLLLIAGTGHFGGSLTHGDDYLTSALFDEEDETAVAADIQPIANVPEANIYADVVKPIFQTRCYSCHGDKKQKGQLRMDNPEALLKGGKNGDIITSGKPAESELIKRLLLPETDEHHMPPKGKPRLTKDQIALLHWWVETGAAFDKKIKDLPQNEKIKPALMALQNGPKKEEKTPVILPEETVAAADQKAIEVLRAKGVVVVPLAQGSNYLEVNFVSVQNETDKDMELLLPLKKQLLSLKLNNAKIGDEAMNHIKECSRLRVLQLNNTAITDKGLALLSALKELRTVSLVGTKVSADGLMAFKGLPNLETIYLFQTNVSKAGWAQLKSSFPKTILDTGGYRVPILESDTTEFVKKREATAKAN